MLHSQLVTAFGRLRRWFHPERKLEGLHSTAQMRIVLERERARADRTGDPLSVIAFTARSPEVDAVTAGWLVKILQARLRCLDAIGWLEDRKIGAVLPGATPEGASKVVADVGRNFPASIPAPCHVVYSYPSVPPPGEHEGIPSGIEAATAPLEVLLSQPLPLWKRGIDIAGAASGLILLAPLLGGIALAIKIASPGPVLFRQRRSGRLGCPFFIYKFRTMEVNAEARQAELLARNERDGPVFKIKDDPRVTRLGRFLRCTSLDELPQLWNVLRGEMSLVGPRPLPCAESDRCTGWQRQRLDVTPGLTCIWQVRGRGGVSFADWVRMDVQYIRARSFWQDLKLLLLTLPAVVLRKGAH